MITKETFIPYLIALDPDFAPRFEKYLERWNGERLSHLEMSEFSHFVSERLVNGSYSKAEAVFEGIEYLLQDGNSDETVSNAVCTCFLENLQNFIKPGGLSANSFVHLLAPRSRSYCKSWDAFTGVKTSGLWKPGEFAVRRFLKKLQESVVQIRREGRIEWGWKPENYHFYRKKSWLRKFLQTIEVRLQKRIKAKTLTSK